MDAGKVFASEQADGEGGGEGITGADGLRTAPSAGATFPLVLYLVAGRIEGIPAGLYRFTPQGHRLLAVGRTDLIAEDLTEPLARDQWRSVRRLGSVQRERGDAPAVGRYLPDTALTFMNKRSDAHTNSLNKYQ